jgi:hypothetical protein
VRGRRLTRTIDTKLLKPSQPVSKHHDNNNEFSQSRPSQNINLNMVIELLIPKMPAQNHALHFNLKGLPQHKMEWPGESDEESTERVPRWNR